MKKHLKTICLVLVIAAFALMAMASGDSTSETSGSGVSDGDDKQSISTSTSSQREIPVIEEQVILDSDGVVVTAKEYVTESFMGDGIKILVENNSNRNLGVSCDALIVNDFMISDLFSCSVAAGKKANDTIYISSSALKEAGISNIGQIELYMHTYDSDTYSTVSNAPCAVIKTSLYDRMDSIEECEGQKLYDQDGVKIVGRYVSDDSFWGKGILLYIENNSGKDVTVQCDDLSVNGFMMTPFFSSTVYDGKKAMSEITLMSSELSENDITEVKDVELIFKLFDPESFMTYAESGPIAFSVE